MSNLTGKTTHFQNTVLGAAQFPMVMLKACGINRDKSIFQSQIIELKYYVKKKLTEISKLPITISETGLKAYNF